MASASNKGRRPFRWRRTAWLPALAILTFMSACTRDSYEPRLTIEGTYYPSCGEARPKACPNGCPRIEGRSATMFAPLSSVIVTVCQPIRVSELGTLTLDSDYQSEAGRLEFADSAVYIQTELMRRHGRFEYSERSPTPNDWTRNNPLTTGVLVLIGFIGLAVVVSIPVGLKARTSRNDLRKQVGIILRFPIVVLVAVLWLTLVWWWIVGFAVFGALIALVGVPLTYPFLYFAEWLRLAFLNSDEPTCPNYFKGYPDDYLNWISNAMRLGFPTLNKWIFEGWNL